ncbi:MAG TPA: hypothetical protein VMH41_12300 [Mycobacteriales bacterium]|nr:hypothetical protein [Mycobacteriales bacterium]
MIDGASERSGHTVSNDLAASKLVIYGFDFGRFAALSELPNESNVSRWKHHGAGSAPSVG